MRILIALMLCMTGLFASAQQVDRPWFGVLNVSSNMYDGAAGTEVFNVFDGGVGFQSGIGYTFVPSLSAVANLGWTRINFSEENKSVVNNFLQGGLSLEYHFNNGYLIPQESAFQPYLTVGGAFVTQNDEVYGALPVGGGFRIAANDDLAFTVSSVYYFVERSGFEYLQNSVGVLFRLGQSSGGGSPVAQILDNDGDGIPNDQDDCPNVAGVRSANGCPDSDGDGVADQDDKCPDVAGTAEQGGCPDADGDGVIDPEDECPNTAGTVNGCPDTDGDGVLDKDDECPEVAGLTSLNGCPDADGDGVIDSEDKCPQEAGIQANKGCPEVDEETVEILRLALQGVKFESGKNQLTSSSLDILDRVVETLKSHPAYGLKISGYTDSSGNAESNLKLSDDRAHAVEQYLISKGIAASRLTAKGYGIENPVASNDTREGRAKNRRVEFEIIY